MFAAVNLPAEINVLVHMLLVTEWTTENNWPNGL
jgi:hypothetical protein